MNFLAQFENFTTKLPNQFGQLGRLGNQRWGDKRAFHNTDACTQNLARAIGQWTRENGLGEALRVVSKFKFRGFEDGSRATWRVKFPPANGAAVV